MAPLFGIRFFRVASTFDPLLGRQQEPVFEVRALLSSECRLSRRPDEALFGRSRLAAELDSITGEPDLEAPPAVDGAYKAELVCVHVPATGSGSAQREGREPSVTL